MPDGNSILSPVGNRVSIFDLVKWVSGDLRNLQREYQSDNDYYSQQQIFDLAYWDEQKYWTDCPITKGHPSHHSRPGLVSRIILTVEHNRGLTTTLTDGRALLINLPRRVVLNHFNFKEKVRAIQFSPDARWIAVNHGNNLQIWKAPGFTKEFAPFVLYRTFTGHFDEILTISWSPDSK